MSHRKKPVPDLMAELKASLGIPPSVPEPSTLSESPKGSGETTADNGTFACICFAAEDEGHLPHCVVANMRAPDANACTCPKNGHGHASWCRYSGQTASASAPVETPSPDRRPESPFVLDEPANCAVCRGPIVLRQGATFVTSPDGIFHSECYLGGPSPLERETTRPVKIIGEDAWDRAIAAGEARRLAAGDATTPDALAKMPKDIATWVAGIKHVADHFEVRDLRDAVAVDFTLRAAETIPALTAALSRAERLEQELATTGRMLEDEIARADRMTARAAMLDERLQLQHSQSLPGPSPNQP